MSMCKESRAWIATGLLAVVLTAAITAPAMAREVRSQDLMTFQERYEFWSKMRDAKMPQERQLLWQRKHAELQMRAAERGVTIRNPGPGFGTPYGAAMAPNVAEAAPAWRPPAPETRPWSPAAVAPTQPSSPRVMTWYAAPYSGGVAGGTHPASPHPVSPMHAR
ncbi:hypothetical protein WCLP8_250016 [uncultured Gammaproteobacteria bacterium]